MKIAAGLNDRACLKSNFKRLNVALVKPQPGHSIPNNLTCMQFDISVMLTLKISCDWIVKIRTRPMPK